MDVFEKEVQMIKMMGFDGKSLVNPRQIDIVHKVFTPTQKEIIFAEKVVREIDEKKAQTEHFLHHTQSLFRNILL